MGYTIEQFVGEVNSFLICKVCEKVFMKPCLADCGCTFCWSCCQSLTIDGFCPSGHRVKSNVCKEIRTITAMVDALNTKCIFCFVGCKEVFQLIHFEAHTLSCRFNPHNVIKFKQEFGTKTDSGDSATTPNYQRQIADLQLELQIISQARDIFQAKYEKQRKENDELLRKNHNLKREFEEIKSALEQQLNQIYKEKEMQQQQIGYNYKTNPPQYSSRYTGPPMMPSFNGEDEATTYGSNLSMIKPIKKRRMTDSSNSSCESPLQVVCCPDVPLPVQAPICYNVKNNESGASVFMAQLIDKLKEDEVLLDSDIEKVLRLVDFRTDLIYDLELFLVSFYDNIKLFVQMLETTKPYLVPGAKVSLISSDISIPLAFEARCFALLVGSKGRVYYHVPNDCVVVTKRELEGTKVFSAVEVFGKQMVGQDLNFVLENSRVRQRQPKELMVRVAVGGAWLTRLQKTGESRWDWMIFKRSGYESSEKIPFPSDDFDKRIGPMMKMQQEQQQRQQQEQQQRQQQQQQQLAIEQAPEVD